MRFTALAKGVHYSPYKLRPLADVMRGKRADYATAWCRANKTRRMEPLIKVLDSAIANARYKHETLSASSLVIRQICVDQGKVLTYFKPGAQGRAMVRRRRTCHISIVLENTAHEVAHGSKG